MVKGLLWFDNDPRATLVAKVATAVAYYKDKHGTLPDICYVHPSMMPIALNDDGVPDSSGKKAVSVVLDGLEINAKNNILPNNFWLGRKS